VFLEQMKKKVHDTGMRIVLPDGGDDRALRAAASLRDEGCLEPILIGKPKDVESRAKSIGVNLKDIAVQFPEDDDNFDAYVETYHGLRKEKGITLAQAKEKVLLPQYFGALMVQGGAADGMVSGLSSHTKPFIPAFQIVKLQEGYRRASSVFVLEWPERLLFFADCSVNINPDAQTLCDIAHATQQTVKWFGHEPRVAFLSFSTRDSAKGELVDKVKQATELARKECPNVVMDGEIQFDAALLPEVARIKAPDSPFCEEGANVFIFPDLNSGNIAYKITERLGRARATGPILQGLKHPINDVSRGCSADDFANVAVLTAALAFLQRKKIPTSQHR
jgi:phosphate acetyltransferase